MKKQIIILTFLLLSTITYGQSNEIKLGKSILLGLTFSPDYCYRTLNYEQKDENFAEYRNEIEIPKFGFTTGISAVFQLNQSLFFESGILFSDKGQQTKKFRIDQEYPDQTIPEQIKNNWHYYYIGIPIRLNYFFKKGNLKIFISPGFSANIFLEQKRVKYEYNPDEQYTYYSTEGFNKLNIEAIFGAGLEYNVEKKIALRFEPIFRYSLTALSNSEINRYQYSIGANFGIYYNIK